MRSLRFRIRNLMIVIAFLALGLTVVMQAVWLQSAAVRDQMLRAQVVRSETLQLERDRAVKQLLKLMVEVEVLQNKVYFLRQQERAKAETAVDKNAPRRP
jgi:uncharacterized protein YlxW (UPF0749 family)